MTDLDDFLATTLARQLEAEEAIHNGDPAPRLAMWSAKDPVTVLGAVRTATGWAEVSELFRWLGAHFSDCTAYRREDGAWKIVHRHADSLSAGQGPLAETSTR
jgi:hypothetical protein